MRQIGDMLVWLAMILVVAAVVYYTPQVANYVSSRDSHPVQRSVAWYSRPHVEEPASADTP